MKIALPVDQPSLESKVADNFGRAANFLFYDLDTDTASYVDNSAVMSQGGAGIKAAQVIVDAKVDALIVPRCGENAAAVLKQANVVLYAAANSTAKENIAAYKAGRLELLNTIHAGFHRQG